MALWAEGRAKWRGEVGSQSDSPARLHKLQSCFLFLLCLLISQLNLDAWMHYTHSLTHTQTLTLARIYIWIISLLYIAHRGRHVHQLLMQLTSHMLLRIRSGTSRALQTPTQTHVLTRSEGTCMCEWWLLTRLSLLHASLPSHAPKWGQPYQNFKFLNSPKNKKMLFSVSSPIFSIYTSRICLNSWFLLWSRVVVIGMRYVAACEFPWKWNAIKRYTRQTTTITTADWVKLFL